MIVSGVSTFDLLKSEVFSTFNQYDSDVKTLANDSQHLTKEQNIINFHILINNMTYTKQQILIRLSYIYTEYHQMRQNHHEVLQYQNILMESIDTSIDYAYKIIDVLEQNGRIYIPGT